MKNLIIVDNKDLERKKEIFSKEGKDKIHVVTDFDRTLTKVYVNGKMIPSIISILRDGDYISKDYAEKAHALYNKYRPIEKDSNIPIKEKKKKMKEWWAEHFKLLIKSGLNKKHLEIIIKHENIKFREHALEFFSILRKFEIPLIIISSSGLGDAIPMLLKRENCLYSNIHIISNFYRWDKDGKAIGIKKPIIHSLNKEEISIKSYPVFNLIKNRKNVILLGDSLDDVGAVKGFDCKNLIKIGFLNEDINKNLVHYRKKFDVLLLNDTDMNYVIELIKEIVK